MTKPNVEYNQEMIMEAIKHIVRTLHDHEVKIGIPPHVPENDLVEIIMILRKRPDDFEQKISEQKTAMKDKLFLRDLKEITDEFGNVDLEEWEE